MNKKIVTLIIVILISFCFLSFVVAENFAYDDNNATDHDNNQTTDENKTDDGPDKNYIIAKGNGDDIKFSDGYRGFRLDYSKSPASSGDGFEHASTSKAANSNTLKLAIIESYKLGLSGQIGKIMADFIKTGTSNTPVGAAVAASHEKVGDHVVVKIDENTTAIFDFEYLESASGNESDYFAYKVSIIKTNDEKNITNVTNITNITNLNSTIDNETNTTFLDDLFEFLEFLANLLYDAWKPIIDTLINYIVMLINALEELIHTIENIIAEIQSLIDAIEQLINMLESISKELDGLLKLLAMLLTFIDQLLNLLGYIWNFIVGLISTIISLIQQLINFIVNLINQIISFIQAILDMAQTVGSALITVIENAAIIITTFVIFTIGAFVYNRRK